MKSTVLRKKATFRGRSRLSLRKKGVRNHFGERKTIENITVLLQQIDPYNKNNTTNHRNSQEFVPFRGHFLRVNVVLICRNGSLVLIRQNVRCQSAYAQAQMLVDSGKTSSKTANDSLVCGLVFVELTELVNRYRSSLIPSVLRRPTGIPQGAEPLWP